MLRFHYKKIMGDIADALRTKTKTSNKIKVKDIPQTILDITTSIAPQEGVVDTYEFTPTVYGRQTIPITQKKWTRAIIIPENWETLRWVSSSQASFLIGFMGLQDNTTYYNLMNTAVRYKNADKLTLVIDGGGWSQTGKPVSTLESFTPSYLYFEPNVKYTIYYYNS